MTVYFLDTSALVKRYHRERGSEVIDALFAEEGRRIIISDLSIIEFGSAPSKKVREGEITPEKYQRALGLFCQDIVTETIHVEILGDADKALAATLIEKQRHSRPGMGVHRLASWSGTNFSPASTPSRRGGQRSVPCYRSCLYDDTRVSGLRWQVIQENVPWRGPNSIAGARRP